MMMKRGMVASNGTWGYPIRAYIPVYQKNSCTLLFSGLRSPYATGVLSTLFSV